MSARQQLLSGLFFIAFGAFAVWAGRDLAIGTAADMGIGYTPRALALGCIGVGMVLGVQALLRGRRVGEAAVSFAWRPLALVTAMVVAFALLLPLLGLPLTVLAVTFAAALSGEDFHLATLVAIAGAMALFTTLLFPIALKLQIPLWPL
jgi:hypothetical protein